jgi:hypothetical protein
VSDSRVEISDESKLSWERADDGVRVHLSQGSVIVNAKTGTRRLYVHTKDLMAGGAGSAFLVVAEETGSRVAVIHGDVRVQQGATEKVLHAGEQFATNPAMEKLQIKEAISWSRNAEAYVAFLTEVEPAIIPALAPQERTTFEIISIRPSTPFAAPGGGGRGTAGGGGGNRPERSPERDQIRANSIICGGAELDVNPGRFVLTGGTVYRLVILAYGLNECSLALQNGKVSGGPEWARSERFDIQATIPAGTPPYTRQQLNAG